MNALSSQIILKAYAYGGLCETGFMGDATGLRLLLLHKLLTA